MKGIFILPLLFVATVTVAFADDPPSDWPDSFPMGFEKASAPLSHGFRMGSLDIQFEKTTLAEVRQAIGVGQIASKGDAGEYALWLCYTFANAKSAGRLWISASGEMGGPEHLIGGIEAELDSSAVPTTDCPALPPQFLPMSFDHGIWLGMKSSDAVAALGPGYSKQGKLTVYGYISKPDKNDCQLGNLLMFKNASGVVQSIEANQVTSC